MGSCAGISGKKLNNDVNNEIKNDKERFDGTTHMIMMGSCHSYAIDMYTIWKDIVNDYDSENRKHPNQNKLLLYGYVNSINVDSIMPKDIYELIHQFMGNHILTHINKIDNHKYSIGIHQPYELTYFPLSMDGLSKQVKTYSFLDNINCAIWVSNISLFNEWIDDEQKYTPLLLDIDIFHKIMHKIPFKHYVRILCFTGIDKFIDKVKQNEYDISDYGIDIKLPKRDTDYITTIMTCIKEMYRGPSTRKFYELYWYTVNENDIDNMQRIRGNVHRIVFRSQLSHAS